MIAAATNNYQPEKYNGKVLVVLATDYPPHVNNLPGWQAIIPRNLQTLYVDGYHRDLSDTRNARTLANAIVSHLTTDESLYHVA